MPDMVPSETVYALGMAAILLFTLIATVTLGIVLRSQRAVHISQVNERDKTVRMAFRNRSYFEQFQQANKERIQMI